jgi:hypothetical protein
MKDGSVLETERSDGSGLVQTIKISQIFQLVEDQRSSGGVLWTLGQDRLVVIKSYLDSAYLGM